ncbi:MAG TPA: RlmE family RNA methyltransferase [Candidatus Kryptonia bacterium]|nr:RlmE family RNA methyltransferase [Candidatus Kryptonia bacterium]
MYQRKDRFYRRAKSVGYRSRAAFKLIELDRRFRLLRSGDHVVDLGAWPGGWLQVAAQRVGTKGLVVGVDLTPIEPLAGPVACVIGDARDDATLAKVGERCHGRVDVVLSDMAPQLSGVRAADEARATELATSALNAAEILLRPGGRLLIKLFQSDESIRFVDGLRREFNSVKLTRPEATRTGSAELYVVAEGFHASPRVDSEQRRNS